MGYFNNKTIWITGASSGIGRSLTIQLAKLGAKLVITARRKEELEKVKLECGNAEVHIHPFDLSDLDNLDEFSNSVQKEIGDIDILINNAGISAWSSINGTQFKVYEDVMNLDFFSVVKLIQSVLPNMILRKEGQIVTNTSLLGKFAIKKRSVYASAKHALHGFMDALRAEVYEHNIKVNIVAPGFVNTEVGMKALTEDGTPYGANDRGHESQGMDVNKAANMIIQAIEKNKRESYIVPKFAFPRVVLIISRFLPGLAAIIARRYNEENNK
ncbi:uncharacterized protein METZ01_LOCUS129056 [marine metagenome]|jgi:short-subunit dehydrogenase|uniref:Uncharacterized protein n=1 Tax=marine metagenome TaxID=408172 RepID=A0A381YHW2_9ZZZZ|tara:strand:+ start:117 stop:929 length:813 start_codon:yes stop_codon:yes gene_type:complete